MPKRPLTIDSSADDVLVVGGTTLVADGATLEAGTNEADSRDCAMRFTGVSIPDGATINRAILLIYHVGDTGDPQTTLSAELTPASVPIASAPDFAARPQTLSTVEANGARPNGYRSIDITSIIQELADLYGSLLSVIHLFHRNNGSDTGGDNRAIYHSFDGDPALSATLLLTFNHSPLYGGLRASGLYAT